VTGKNKPISDKIAAHGIEEIRTGTDSISLPSRIAPIKRSITACREETIGRPREIERGYFLTESLNRTDLGTVVQIPDLDDLIGSGSCQDPAIRLPGHVEDMMGMSFERLEQFA